MIDSAAPKSELQNFIKADTYSQSLYVCIYDRKSFSQEVFYMHTILHT